MPKPSKPEITAQIAALQAQLAECDGGVYEDPRTGRWFIVMRPPGRAKTTTRRRALDGSRLTAVEAVPDADPEAREAVEGVIEFVTGPWTFEKKSWAIQPRHSEEELEQLNEALTALLRARGVRPYTIRSEREDEKRDDGTMTSRLLLSVRRGRPIGRRQPVQLVASRPASRRMLPVIRRG